MKKQVFMIGFLTLMSLLIIGCNTTGTGNTGTGNVPMDSDDYIKIPLSDLSEDVQFYTYKDNGVNVNYFVVLGSDGKPRTAFDACDVCGGYKGYEQRGSDIVCRNCGKVFRIDGLGTQNRGSGCWPSYLPHQVEGDEIFIKITDIEEGRHWFV